MKARQFAIAIVVATICGINSKAFAGPNDFFGSQIGGSPDVTQGTVGAADGQKAINAAQQMPAGAPAGDYSVDEKRVQHKYKDDMHHAQGLINKGEAMMKSHDEKMAKKGRVLKEIGEKAIADLKSNNPFPELAAKEPKKTN